MKNILVSLELDSSMIKDYIIKDGKLVLYDPSDHNQWDLPRHRAYEFIELPDNATIVGVSEGQLYGGGEDEDAECWKALWYIVPKH